jgi:plasmid replication initiation protein
MSNTLVSKSFYLTSLFADIKSDHTWTTHEAKLAILLISELNKYKIYLPDLDKKEIKFELEKRIKEIPQEYTFHRNKFKEITGVADSVVSREIKKVIKGLLSKTMIMPHPLEESDSLSIYGITWFSKIEYSNKTGYIKMKVNDEIILRLIAFAKYSKISFDSIIKIQNHNSIYSFLFFKILKDSSKYTELNISVLEFKEKIGLKDKYKEIKHFKVHVLEVIKKDINRCTEMNLDYELVKEGRSFNKINFTFDYKPEYLEQNTKSKSKKIKQLNVIENAYIDDNESPFEQTLVTWGIRAKKVVEIEETYSLDVIQSAIELTLEKEKAGEIKTTKAAIFLGILENKQQASDEVFEREQQQLVKQHEKDQLKALGAEYDAIQKVINDNDDEVSSYLSAKAMGATYEISPALNEQLLSMSCVDAEKFKGFRPKLTVLYNGYFDMNTKKEVRPNMYCFLNLI